MSLAMIFIICFLLIIFTVTQETVILPNGSKTIEGLNKYETALVNKFIRHINYEENSDLGSLRKNDNITSFYMRSKIGSVDIDKVMYYVNMNPEIKYVIDEITIEYNKERTEAKWYCVTFSRKSSVW